MKGPVLDAQVADNDSNDPFFGNLYKQMQIPGMMKATRPLRVSAKTIELNVLPRPTAAKGANWLPAQTVTLEETWHPAAETMHVGEPLTRHLHLNALGLTGGQLPELSSMMQVPEGIKAYPDQSSVADNTQGNTVLGSRDQDIALMATRPGRYELPAVVVHWWDTVNNTTREATLPARVLDVLPAAAGKSNASIPLDFDTHAGTADQSNQLGQGSASTDKLVGNQIWPWLSLALALLWLGTMLAWWRARQGTQSKLVKNADQKHPQKVQASSALKAFKQACSHNQANEAQQQLLAWAASVWPADQPVGLNELARRMADDKLVHLLRELDRVCYAGGAWQGEALAQSISSFSVQATKAENKNVLPALYPEK